MKDGEGKRENEMNEKKNAISLNYFLSPRASLVTNSNDCSNQIICIFGKKEKPIIIIIEFVHTKKKQKNRTVPWTKKKRKKKQKKTHCSF